MIAANWNQCQIFNLSCMRKWDFFFVSFLMFQFWALHDSGGGIYIISYVFKRIFLFFDGLIYKEIYIYCNEGFIYVLHLSSSSRSVTKLLKVREDSRRGFLWDQNHFGNISWPFRRQFHKMDKHTQTIRRLLPTNCVSVFDHFMGSALKGLRSKQIC